jgi:ATP-dependent Clp protease ATP-binding subunit ClpC
MSIASHEAHQICRPYIGSEHLLLGILRDEGNVAAKALHAVGINFDGARSEMLRHISVLVGADPTDDRVALTFTPRAAKVLAAARRAAARRAAARRGEAHVAPEHLLLGIIADGQGLAARILRELGVDLGAVAKGVESLMPGQGT